MTRAVVAGVNRSSRLGGGMRIDVIVCENAISSPVPKGVHMDAWELEVRESVRQTIADYTAATDRFDLRGLGACFGPDGVLEFTGGAHPLTGPAEIEAGLGAAMSKDSDPTRQPPTTYARSASGPTSPTRSTGSRSPSRETVTSRMRSKRASARSC